MIVLDRSRLECPQILYSAQRIYHELFLAREQYEVVAVPLWTCSILKLDAGLTHFSTAKLQRARGHAMPARSPGTATRVFVYSNARGKQRYQNRKRNKDSDLFL
jgi:hypothetical protein